MMKLVFLLLEINVNIYRLLAKSNASRFAHLLEEEKLLGKVKKYLLAFSVLLTEILVVGCSNSFKNEKKTFILNFLIKSQ